MMNCPLCNTEMRDAKPGNACQNTACDLYAVKLDNYLVGTIRNAVAAARQQSAAYTSNLLAVIHRDGGQYEVENGTEKAVADALVLIPMERGISEELIVRARAEGFEMAREMAIECATSDDYEADIDNLIRAMKMPER